VSLVREKTARGGRISAAGEGELNGRGGVLKGPHPTLARPDPDFVGSGCQKSGWDFKVYRATKPVVVEWENAEGSRGTALLPHRQL